ncbi:hypothetical protein LTR93_011314 [Exophiala xenobiotica]|nr:hypothetical protein LTR93_011314 [Exophiala xenobiotica]
MVQTLPIGSIQVPVPGFGAMGISSAMGAALNYEQAEPVLLRALELGCTFWDTAVAYGAGMNEKLLGEFVSNSPEHIRTYIDGTIERLGFAPDLYYLHRIDPNTPLDVSIPTLDGIRKAGKCKYIGLARRKLFKANSIARIDAVQAEYSAFETLHETDGLIDTAKELDIAFVAFSPLGHGWLVDNFYYASPDDFAPDDFRRTVPKFQGENFYKNKAIVEQIKKLAKVKGCKTTQLALAWVAGQGMIPIAGTTKSRRLEENWGCREVDFTEEEKMEMRRIIEEAKPTGDRFSAIHQSMVGH